MATRFRQPGGLLVHISAGTIACLGLLFSIAAIGYAEDPPKPKEGATKEAAPKEKDVPAPVGAKKIPKPEDLTFDTRDKVRIAATWYAAVNDKQKETVPVILIHGYKGDRREYHDLAMSLQNKGYSTLAIDLRGHGESTSLVGSEEKIHHDRFKKEDFAEMWEDVEAAKKFLMDKNESEELNIDRLAIVAAEVGGTVALQWAAYDLTRPTLAGVNKRQGQWVKAVVLLSPVYNFKGYSINPLLTQSEEIAHTLPIYVVYGKTDKDSDRVAKQLKKSRPALKSADKDKPAPQSLVFRQLDTSLSGVKLLTLPELQVAERVAKFIEIQAKEPKYPWEKRRWDE